jgi:hypothetical protein
MELSMNDHDYDDDSIEIHQCIGIFVERQGFKCHILNKEKLLKAAHYDA